MWYAPHKQPEASTWIRSSSPGSAQSTPTVSYGVHAGSWSPTCLFFSRSCVVSVIRAIKKNTDVLPLLILSYHSAPLRPIETQCLSILRIQLQLLTEDLCIELGSYESWTNCHRCLMDRVRRRIRPLRWSSLCQRSHLTALQSRFLVGHFYLCVFDTFSILCDYSWCKYLFRPLPSLPKFSSSSQYIGASETHSILWPGPRS